MIQRIRSLVPAVFGALVVLSIAGRSAAEDWIELVIPLEEGRYYSLDEVRQEYERKLGTASSPGGEDWRLKITPLDRAALRLAGESGLLRVRMEPGRLLVSVPDPESDQARQDNRRRLERLLGISLTPWPEGLGLHVPKEFDSRRRTAVLLSGLRAGPESLERLAEACERWGVQTLRFDYPNNGPIAWSGDRLSADLKRFAQEEPQTRLVVIAHSLGGLVVRHALEAPDRNPGKVTDLFFLGTPHGGSGLADVADLLDLIDPPGIALTEALRNGLNEAGDDLRPESRFLRELNARPRPEGVRYHAAIGHTSFLPDDQKRLLDDRLKVLSEKPELSEATRRRLLILLKSPELCSGQGDGVVSCSSATLPQLISTKTFALDHLELLSLPGQNPQETEVFQWLMQTLTWERDESPLS